MAQSESPEAKVRQVEAHYHRKTLGADGRVSTHPTIRIPLHEVGPPIEKNPGKTPICAIMKSVICVRPEVDVEDLEKLLLEQGVSGVPVVDAEGFLVGVVTKTDIVRHEKLENEHWVERMGQVRVPAKVGEVMTRHPASIHETATITEVSKLMVSRRIHRLPIVSKSGQVLAIVTPFDVLDWLSS